MMGTFPKFKFPDASQGPTVQTGLFVRGAPSGLCVHWFCTLAIECPLEGTSPAVGPSRFLPSNPRQLKSLWNICADRAHSPTRHASQWLACTYCSHVSPEVPAPSAIFQVDENFI